MYSTYTVYSTIFFVVSKFEKNNAWKYAPSRLVVFYCLRNFANSYYLYIFSHFTSNTNTNLRLIKFDV